jgi:hypothetical protein
MISIRVPQANDFHTLDTSFDILCFMFGTDAAIVLSRRRYRSTPNVHISKRFVLFQLGVSGHPMPDRFRISASKKAVVHNLAQQKKGTSSTGPLHAVRRNIEVLPLVPRTHRFLHWQAKPDQLPEEVQASDG